ncbi:MAG: glycosyltransferase family 2 protein [Flavobacteriales bacterium]|nr:glycosyltransferase family 2 protein [Flavobacteriales bacterium]
MNMVIPMAGAGQRFVDAGYEIPKYLIQAKGKSLLEWSVDSLPLDICSRLIFVVLASHEKEHGLENWLNDLYGKYCPVSLVMLDAPTRGQAETVMKARDVIDPSASLLIYNIDTRFVSDTLQEMLCREDNDGVLGCFESIEPRFSFAKTDDHGRVVEVTEKVPISTHALTGLYHFRNANDFFQVASDSIAANETVKGEFYVAPMYNALITQGRNFVLDQARHVDILGTPEELNQFLAS